MLGRGRSLESVVSGWGEREEREEDGVGKMEGFHKQAHCNNTEHIHTCTRAYMYNV